MSEARRSANTGRKLYNSKLKIIPINHEKLSKITLDNVKKL